MHSGNRHSEVGFSGEGKSSHLVDGPISLTRHLLRVAHSKKEQKHSKKVGRFYPFGFKHKGYSNVVSSNGNSTVQKFGYKGKELSEELSNPFTKYEVLKPCETLDNSL